jgi:hypothetical protein
VWLVSAGRLGVGLFAAVALAGLAGGASGCLSDDTTAVPVVKDAGFSFDGGNGGTPDASGAVDGASAPDAAVPDAAVPDAAFPDAASNEGKDPAVVVPSQTGLVGAGAVGHSPGYTMTGTLGPATAPVLTAPNYKLVGGVSVTGHNP